MTVVLVHDVYLVAPFVQCRAGVGRRHNPDCQDRAFRIRDEPTAGYQALVDDVVMDALIHPSESVHLELWVSQEVP